MVNLLDGAAIFVRDCVSFRHSKFGVLKGTVVKYCHQGSATAIFAVVDTLLNLQQFKDMVPQTTDTLIIYNQLLFLFPLSMEQMVIFHVTHLNQKLLVGELLCYLVLFSDDTSGNNTKKWHKMELWNLMLAGLPRHINSRHENIHFLSCSDLVSSLEQSKPIAQQLILLETEGVVVYDSLYDEDVLVVVPLLCIVCDNPMASQLCNHLVGGTALMFCRICMAKRTVNPDVVCERRTRSSALQQIAEILAQPTERDKVEKRKEFGLNEHENPLLHIPVDMFQSTPVEVLHTMGLGAIKYLLEELMPKMNARQKKEILARLRAFNTSGMQRYASSASFIAALSLVAVALCQREDQLSSATETNEAAKFPGRSLLGTALVFTRGNSTLTYDSDNAECHQLNTLKDTQDKCLFVTSVVSCHAEGLIDYLRFIYCQVPTRLFPLAIILLCLWILYLFIVLGATAQEFFCPSLQIISEMLRLSQNVAIETFTVHGFIFGICSSPLKLTFTR
eukprot:Em0002g886a